MTDDTSKEITDIAFKTIIDNFELAVPKTKKNKRYLQEQILRLKHSGDKVLECAEVMADDPVVKAYYEELARTTGPLWIEATPFTESFKPVRDEWDSLIGELQGEQLVDPFPSDDDEVVWEVDSDDLAES